MLFGGSTGMSGFGGFNSYGGPGNFIGGNFGGNNVPTYSSMGSMGSYQPPTYSPCMNFSSFGSPSISNFSSSPLFSGNRGFSWNSGFGPAQSSAWGNPWSQSYQSFPSSNSTLPGSFNTPFNAPQFGQAPYGNYGRFGVPPLYGFQQFQAQSAPATAGRPQPQTPIRPLPSTNAFMPPASPFLGRTSTPTPTPPTPSPAPPSSPAIARGASPAPSVSMPNFFGFGGVPQFGAGGSVTSSLPVQQQAQPTAGDSSLSPSPIPPTLQARNSGGISFAQMQQQQQAAAAQASPTPPISSSPAPPVPPTVTPAPTQLPPMPTSNALLQEYIAQQQQARTSATSMLSSAGTARSSSPFERAPPPPPEFDESEGTGALNMEETPPVTRKAKKNDKLSSDTQGSGTTVSVTTASTEETKVAGQPAGEEF